jgi:uncharacterized protein YbbC (DUF1343 family)
MRSLTQALLYPGIGILETTNISVGRGTATPFEVVGAPWMDGAAVARSLTDSALPGVTFEAITFTPDASKHAGKTCSGVRFRVTDRDALRPVRLGITLACILQRLHPDAWETKSLDRLLKHRATRDGILGGATPAALEHAWESERAAYLRMRKPFLLYERP